VADDDIGNLRGALLAAKLGGEVRTVLRLFNEELGERLETLFEDCTILVGPPRSSHELRSSSRRKAPCFTTSWFRSMAPRMPITP
jgi:hypothetical protein